MLVERLVYSTQTFTIVLLLLSLTNSFSVDFKVLWYAPFLSGGGYCSEAFALKKSFLTLPSADVSPRHHGDTINEQFIAGLGGDDIFLVSHVVVTSDELAPETETAEAKDENLITISVCHSEPGAWHAPYPRYHTNKCPPSGSVDYKIGRTMFETDRLPSGWAERMSHLDEIWVPTTFALEIFVDAGVPRDKVIVVGEPVDTTFFHPVSANEKVIFREKYLGQSYSSTFLILFVGKWETRKGLTTLLSAFYKTFTAEMNCALVILTSAYHSSKDFEAQVDNFLITNNLTTRRLQDEEIPRVKFLTAIPQIDMPVLYSSMDILAVPSSGEGWGRPHVEAMACALPIIATNWSGPTAYMNSNNSLPLVVKGYVPAEGWPGHHWAQPDSEHLERLLLYAYHNRSAIRELGRNARQSMEDAYSLEKFGLNILQKELLRIKSIVLEKRERRSNRHPSQKKINAKAKKSSAFIEL